jgi:hypothetical protein
MIYRTPVEALWIEIASPCDEVLIIRRGSMPQCLNQVLVARRSAGVLWRARPSSVGKKDQVGILWIGNRLGGSDFNIVLPTVPHVVAVEKRGAGLEREIRKQDLRSVISESVGPWLQKHAAADFEAEQMVIKPIECELKATVEL